MKEVIKEYLVEKDLYHLSDDVLLVELEFNLELMETAKEDIRENGMKIDITRDPDKESYFIKNRSIDIYQQCLKNIQAIYRQMVLTPEGRLKMKIELQNKQDEFDTIFK